MLFIPDKITQCNAENNFCNQVVLRILKYHGPIDKKKKVVNLVIIIHTKLFKILLFGQLSRK